MKSIAYTHIPFADMLLAFASSKKIISVTYVNQVPQDNSDLNTGIVIPRNIIIKDGCITIYTLGS